MLDHMQSARRSETSRAVTSTQMHELKNRLTVVKGLSQLLGRQVRRPNLERGRLEERVTSLQNELVRIEMLINEIGVRDDAPSALSAHHIQSHSYADD